MKHAATKRIRIRRKAGDVAVAWRFRCPVCRDTITTTFYSSCLAHGLLEVAGNVEPVYCKGDGQVWTRDWFGKLRVNPDTLRDGGLYQRPQRKPAKPKPEPKPTFVLKRKRVIRFED